MATQTRVPTADQVDGNFVRSDTGNNTNLYQVVSDANDSTYLYRTSGTSGCLVQFTAFDAPGASDTINYIRVICRQSRTAAGACNGGGRIQVNGTIYDATVIGLTTSVVEDVFDWATNPNTGAAWTVNDVKGTGSAPLQYFGWRSTAVGAGEEARCHELSILVNYTPAAGGVTATPTTATLTISTFAPTVQTPRLVAPTTLALTLSPFAPTVQTPQVVTPGTLTLSLGTFAPTIQLPVVATPAPLAMGLTTFAPTVALPVIVTPSTLALSLTTFAPTTGSGTTVTPGSASLVLATFAPTVWLPILVTPQPASLTLTGFAPIVLAGSGFNPAWAANANTLIAGRNH